MSANFEYHGLCSTCKNTPHCTLRTDPDRPAFYCEQFEVEKPPAVTRKISSSVSESKKSVELIGLCSDCENLKTCIFPKPEGGVWHCEEYQ